MSETRPHSEATDLVAAALHEDLSAQAPAAIRLACVLGSLAFASFALIDPYVVVGSLSSIYTLRVCLVAALLLLMTLTWSPGFRRRAVAISLITCAVIGLGVVGASVLVGDPSTRYYEALLLTVFGFSLLPLPWHWTTATAMYVALVAAFDVCMAATGQTGSAADWWTTNAMLWFAVLISGTTVRLAADLRRSGVAARLEVQGANARLLEANERLKELDEAKSRFFANLSHELRTPLTLALAPLDALLESSTDLPAGQRADLHLARRSALRMLRLVDDLLALSRLESAALPAERLPVNMVALVGALVEEVTPLARRKDVTVGWEHTEDATWVMGDRAWLERVVLNLLANALKFTESGGRIDASLRCVDGTATLVVSDTGVGIAAAALGRIFERFYQVDGSATRTRGGMGVGLALARELVTLHGGRIEVASQPGKGTAITVVLPAMASAASAAANVLGEPGAGVPHMGTVEWHTQLAGSNDYRLMAVDDASERRVLLRPSDGLARPRLLVIEDNPDMVQLIGGLVGGDYDVFVARDGFAGLQLVHQHAPDIVLSDLMMPGMSGIEVVRELRAHPATRTLPVLMLTARGALEDRLAGQAAGVDAWLTKPFSRAELLATLARLLRNSTINATTHRERGDERVTTMLRGLLSALRGPLARLEAGPIGQGEAAVGELRRILDRLGALEPGQGRGARAAGEILDRAVARLGEVDGRALRMDLDEEAVAVSLPSGVEEVLLEVLLNAVAVTPQGGVIQVELRSGPAGARFQVRDEGPGVDAAARDRVFHPFYTTKFGDPLAGLGLSIAGALAHRCGGRVVLEPSSGPGAVFVVEIPGVGAVAA